MNQRFNSIVSGIIRSFIQGVVLLTPVVLTFWIIWNVFFGIDAIVPSVSREYPGLIFTVVIIGTTLIGRLGERFFIGKLIVNGVDYILMRLPGIKVIYASIKEVVQSFVGDKTKFKTPVLVKVQDTPEQWRIGFLTNENINFTDLENKVSVYLPHSYAVSGWVIIVDRSAILPLDNISATDAMKFAVSGGISGVKTNQVKTNENKKN